MRRMIRRLFQVIRDFVDDSVPTKSGLRVDAREMMQNLDMRADATSLAMTIADEAWKKLGAEVANHDALGNQAEDFLRDGRAAHAERCVAMQLQSKKLIAQLQQEFDRLQADAERLARGFVEKRKEVDEKVSSIPMLEDAARMLAAQERLERRVAEFSVDSAERSFDHVAREIETRRLQFANRAMLLADPNAALDREIRAAVDQREFDTAMAELRRKVGEISEVVEGEVVRAADPVEKARAALGAPRYAGILPVRNQQQSALPVRRR